MLLPEQVRPFLLHEDVMVRGHALRYLAEAHDPSPVNADDIWSAMQLPDGEMRTRCSFYLPRFAVTERSTARLYEAIRSGEYPEIDGHLHRALLALPVETQRHALDDATIAARLSPDTKRDAFERRALAARSFEELWKAFEDLAVESAGVSTVRVPVVARSTRLAEALARFPEQAAARGLEILEGPRPSDSNGGWREIFALQLFARVRYPGPIEPLLALAGDEEGDYGNDRAVDALVHLGTTEVVEAVASRLPTGGDAFRNWGPSILGRIKRPESEAALIRLLEGEDDLYVRTHLAMDLCELCTTSREALESIRGMIESGEYDGMLVNLDEWALVTGKMVGWEPPEAGAWQAQMAAREARRAEKMAALNRLTMGEAGAKPREPAKRRGFVPYGKKARKKR
jgi:hypothetical protein